MNSDNILLILAAALVLLGLAWLLRQRNADPTAEPGTREKRIEALDTVGGWPPEPTRVLTQAERRAYLLLVRALPEHIVLAQVPLARFIRVPTRNSYHEWMRRVGQLCADLVVCDANAQVLTVVEVRRGYGKETERSSKRHERMDRVLHQAGVRVVVWNEDALPSPESIVDQVLLAPRGMHSEEGSASVRTRESRKVPRTAATTTAAGATAMAATAGPSMAAAGPAAARSGASLEEVLDEIDRQPVVVAEPPSSTWFDEFDSGRAPLDRLTPVDPLKRRTS